MGNRAEARRARRRTGLLVPGRGARAARTTARRPARLRLLLRVRRLADGSPRLRFRHIARALGDDRLSGPRDRLLGQERVAREVRRYEPRKLPHDDEHLGLLAGRGDQPGAADDAERGLDPDTELL